VDDANACPSAREHGAAAGHDCLSKLAQGTVCKILDQQEVKPHKVRYYLERRDPEFEDRMAEVLCVYRQIKLVKRTAAENKEETGDAVAYISYDEKPSISTGIPWSTLGPTSSTRLREMIRTSRSLV
jgi:hypothetical protein